jgi:hypothetical protein
MATSTVELKRRFVQVIQSLMAMHGYTAAETARKAEIGEPKRFYRWASKGIARATREHHADLERLRKLFNLPSVGAFWEVGNAKPFHLKLKEAGEVEWEYAYAYKLVVALRSLGKTESQEVQELIDQLFAAETTGKFVTDDKVMEPKTAGKIVSFVRLNAPTVYEQLVSQMSLVDLQRKIQRELGRNGGLSGSVLARKLIADGTVEIDSFEANPPSDIDQVVFLLEKFEAWKPLCAKASEQGMDMKEVLKASWLKAKEQGITPEQFANVFAKRCLVPKGMA